ncbi:hypothetical protein AAC387_Pa03g3900 [Persea americana]
MLGVQATTSQAQGGEENEEVRDIYALTPPISQQQPPRRREAWETSSHRSSNLSNLSDGLSENFSTMSREFNALVLAGSAIEHGNSDGSANGGTNLSRIGEELEETNPLAIVPDSNPLNPAPSPSLRDVGVGDGVGSSARSDVVEEVSLQRVKKEETDSKIMAWQNAEIAKVNNRFKRDDAVINGWEGEQVQKATMWFKKVERKLEEKRAKAMEKMQNEVAQARRKAEEKRASAEAKRGTKVAKVLEVANLMRAVGRAPSKRSFF